MDHPHWHHFLSLESDFIDSLVFVELAPENRATFSVHFTKLLLSAGSEIDVVAKLVCAKWKLDIRRNNIDGYRDALLQRFPDLPAITIQVPRYRLTLNPWSGWSTGNTNPSWWRAYNDVKHERDLHFRQANQENTLHCLCGLFGLVLYLYPSEFFGAELQPFSRLIQYPNQPCSTTIVQAINLPNLNWGDVLKHP